ncbi:hypothetical protein, partial [Sporisorium scitamineum]
VATTAAQQDTLSTSTAAAPTAAAAGTTFPGLDLSALGIDVSSLTNLPDLSSLGIPSLTDASTTNTSNALAPATDLSELEKMMGIDLSSSTNNGASTSNDASPNFMDSSSLGNFNSAAGTGGFGEDTDMYGTGLGGLDLSNFDFSSLTGGGDASMRGSGGVDLSSFLTSFTSNQAADGNQENAGN